MHEIQTKSAIHVGRSHGRIYSMSLVVWAFTATAVQAATFSIVIEHQGSSEIIAGPGVPVPFEIWGTLTDYGDNGGLAGFSFDLQFDGGPLEPLTIPDGAPLSHFVPPLGLANPNAAGGTLVDGRLVQVGGAQNTIGNDASKAPFPIGDVLLEVGHSPVLLASGSLTAPASPGEYRLSAANVIATMIDDGEKGEIGYHPCLLVEQFDVAPLSILVQQLSVSLLRPGQQSNESETNRCLQVVPKAGNLCGQPLDVAVDFSPSTGAGSMTLTPPAGPWSELRVKDEQHSLATSVPLVWTDRGVIPEGVILIRPGDTNNDSKVDIEDVAYFLSQLGQSGQHAACPWNGTRDADFNLDGVVNTEDYTFLATHWLESTPWECNSSATAAAALQSLAKGPSGNTTHRMRVQQEAHVSADLTGDGWIDLHDVAMFERRHGLPPSLSQAMRSSSSQTGRSND